MKQFNQLSSEAQTTIIKTLLSLYSGDLPQHVKDEIAEWKIYSTTVQPQQVTSKPEENWVPITDPNHVLRKNVDQFRSEGVMWNYSTDFTGKSLRSLRAAYPNLNIQFRCLEKDLPVVCKLFNLVDTMLEHTGLDKAIVDADSITVNYYRQVKPLHNLGTVNIQYFLTEYDKLKGQHNAGL
jgi:hypothetical protein